VSIMEHQQETSEFVNNEHFFDRYVFYH
jgi:hypothetical protein